MQQYETGWQRRSRRTRGNGWRLGLVDSPNDEALILRREAVPEQPPLLDPLESDSSGVPIEEHTPGARVRGIGTVDRQHPDRLGLTTRARLLHADLDSVMAELS